MPDIGPMELILVLVIALLVLGPSKLPEIGKSLGSTIREFRKAATDVQESVRLDVPPQPAVSAPAAPAQPAVSAAPAQAVAPSAQPAASAPASSPQSAGPSEPRVGA